MKNSPAFIGSAEKIDGYWVVTPSPKPDKNEIDGVIMLEFAVKWEYRVADAMMKQREEKR